MLCLGSDKSEAQELNSYRERLSKLGKAVLESECMADFPDMKREMMDVFDLGLAASENATHEQISNYELSNRQLRVKTHTFYKAVAMFPLGIHLTKMAADRIKTMIADKKIESNLSPINPKLKTISDKDCRHGDLLIVPFQPELLDLVKRQRQARKTATESLVEKHKEWFSEADLVQCQLVTSMIQASTHIVAVFFDNVKQGLRNILSKKDPPGREKLLQDVENFQKQLTAPPQSLYRTKPTNLTPTKPIQSNPTHSNPI